MGIMGFRRLGPYILYRLGGIVHVYEVLATCP